MESHDHERLERTGYIKEGRGAYIASFILFYMIYSLFLSSQRLKAFIGYYGTTKFRQSENQKFLSSVKID